MTTAALVDCSTPRFIPVDDLPVLDRYDTPNTPPHAGSEHRGKPWLMVYFECCHAYGRLYRNRAATQYSGCCPKCGGRVNARIGAGGTSRRMFKAG